MKIKITLGDGEVGTIATIIKNRLFRQPITEKYICHKVGVLTGGHWVNGDTGRVAGDDLNHTLNMSAQAAANLKERI